jgi:hypothetical protein
LKKWFLLIVVLLGPLKSMCQKTTLDTVQTVPRSSVTVSDSTVVSTVDSLLGKKGKKKFVPNPKTATRLALIPGGGQIYNRDYWKLPIIYLSIGGGVYAWNLNRLKYNDFLSAYESFYILDVPKDHVDYGKLRPDMPNVPVRVRNLLNTESEMRTATKDQIERQKNYWRRNKNLSIIVAGLIYSLTIIEANVAAHLKTFDLSDDISLRVEPKLSQPLLLQPTPGIRLVFNIR